MCGIFALIGNQETNINSDTRNYYLELSKKIRHRGPDWNGIYIDEENKVIIAHERLSIVGVENGSQPLVNNRDNNELVLSVNGEIYNYNDLYKSVLLEKHIPDTKSDCESIIYLYKEFGEQSTDFVKMLDGIFSFVLYDKNYETVIIARDPIGIIPLYIGYTENNELMVASEMKCLLDCVKIISFPPGFYLRVSTSQGINGKQILDFIKDTPTLQYKKNEVIEVSKYYNPNYNKNKFSEENEEVYLEQVNKYLTKSVEKRLMTDVPFGVLLSGGLDSSLIASITSRLMKDRNTGWGNTLHSFSIGLKDAPDLISAKKVADFLGTKHHEYTFTVQEGIDALRDLIYKLETFDVTTIRASTPMYLLSRKIKATGIKMVLSGEGADEILGGYLYFHNAPTSLEFHNECVDRVRGLHNFDCLRANKSTMAWGLEARVPFLDQKFLEVAMPINPDCKLNKNEKIEKYILRKAFDNQINPYLPKEILWRQKEQFSDGVGYSWIDELKVFTENEITNEELQSEITAQNNPNITKEAVYYLKIFDELFPGRRDVVPRWIPRTDWEGVGYDPSGRAQQVHNQTNV